MMTALADTLVCAPMDRVRAAILDPAAYAAGGTKVATIDILERYEDGVLARINGRLGPIRSHIDARYTLHPDRVELQMVRGRLRGFHASFGMVEVPGGVRLSHIEQYDFGYGPLNRVLDRVLSRWATRTVIAEVAAIRRAAEAAPTTATV